MKKIFTMLLVLSLVFSTSLVSFADSTSPENGNVYNQLILYPSHSNIAFTKQDILSLEKYVSVSKHGYFELDVKRALADNVDRVLLKGQQNHFNYLNSFIKKGALKAHSNLLITNNISTTSFYANSSLALELPISIILNTRSHWQSCGGGKNTAVDWHWWGYSRYACDCTTREMASDFNSAASVAAGIGAVAFHFGVIPAIPAALTVAYFGLFASRLNANNRGIGVYIEITWALVYDITPQ
ncbi:MAG: hypothetical protein ACLKAK_05680 [Alkaliphilus sp.]